MQWIIGHKISGRIGDCLAACGIVNNCCCFLILIRDMAGLASDILKMSIAVYRHLPCVAVVGWKRCGIVAGRAHDVGRIVRVRLDARRWRRVVRGSQVAADIVPAHDLVLACRVADGALVERAIEGTSRRCCMDIVAVKKEGRTLVAGARMLVTAQAAVLIRVPDRLNRLEAAILRHAMV